MQRTHPASQPPQSKCQFVRPCASDAPLTILTLASRGDLGDKSYHQIFESLFSFAIREKPVIYDKRKKDTARNAAISRLEKCASAVRMAAARGAFKLGRKTLLALVDHITQVLPGPDDNFVPPLLPNYVKALSEVLSRQCHVEYLARQDAKHWETCVDFLLDITSYILPAESHRRLDSAPRGSPAPGTSTPRSTVLSSNSTQSQRRANQIDGETLRDALHGLKHLFSGGNAPVARRARQVTSLTIRVLELTHLSLGSTQSLCFSLCNIVLASVQSDEVHYAKDLIQGLLPSMAFWWRAEKVSQDELIRGIRNEISRTVLLSHLHIKSLAIHGSNGVTDMLDSLLEPIWQEYSKRSEAFRLQLSDLTFNTTNTPSQSLGNHLFCLYPHNTSGESPWAAVQSLALLEHILISHPPGNTQSVEDAEEYPRKRQRTGHDLARVQRNLKSTDTGVRRTALQVVSFLLARTAPNDAIMSIVAEDLTACAASKDQTTSSWAMIAAAW